ncbi:MAG TPA: GNAT family N-acetyltransferase [Bryobacteraceae bacterium]|nr:GNAT family N-acetyltransferase [Bryobacteraceae bacterium]
MPESAFSNRQPISLGKAPERIETARLLLRRALPSDADSIFARYASDIEVTRYLSWPRHQSRDQTEAFLAFSDSEWLRWPAGPYLIESPDVGTLLGSTGLAFETPDTASTGYALATDAWGHGYATETLAAMVALARAVGVRRLYALCHPDNRASVRVLEKCGFILEALLPAHACFPNLGSTQRQDCLRFGKSAE